jgi:hypothetical protein
VSILSRHRVLAAAMITLLLSAVAAPSAAQFGDFDGMFVVKKPAAGAIPDTVIGGDEQLTWIRHTGAKRTVYVGDYSDLVEEVGIESETIAFTRAGGPAIQVFVRTDGDDEGNFWWEFTVGGGATKQQWRFDHATKRVDPDDLKPRAKLPSAAYADSVVLAVRAIYERVNAFKCAPPSDSDGIPATLQVCARGAWTGRINTIYRVEVTLFRRSYTYDSSGALRFAFSVTEQPGFRGHLRFESRYYFAGGHLVRVTHTKNGGAAKNWEPNEDAWREAEAAQLRRGAACLANSGVAMKEMASDSVVFPMSDAC